MIEYIFLFISCLLSLTMLIVLNLSLVSKDPLRRWAHELGHYIPALLLNTNPKLVNWKNGVPRAISVSSTISSYKFCIIIIGSFFSETVYCIIMIKLFPFAALGFFIDYVRSMYYNWYNDDETNDLGLLKRHLRIISSRILK